MKKRILAGVLCLSLFLTACMVHVEPEGPLEVLTSSEAFQLVDKAYNGAYSKPYYQNTMLIDVGVKNIGSVTQQRAKSEYLMESLLDEAKMNLYYTNGFLYCDLMGEKVKQPMSESEFLAENNNAIDFDRNLIENIECTIEGQEYAITFLITGENALKFLGGGDLGLDGSLLGSMTMKFVITEETLKKFEVSLSINGTIIKIKSAYTYNKRNITFPDFSDYVQAPELPEVPVISQYDNNLSFNTKFTKIQANDESVFFIAEDRKLGKLNLLDNTLIYATLDNTPTDLVLEGELLYISYGYARKIDCYNTKLEKIKSLKTMFTPFKIAAKGDLVYSVTDYAISDLEETNFTNNSNSIIDMNNNKMFYANITIAGDFVYTVDTGLSRTAINMCNIITKDAAQLEYQDSNFSNVFSNNGNVYFGDNSIINGELTQNGIPGDTLMDKLVGVTDTTLIYENMICDKETLEPMYQIDFNVSSAFESGQKTYLYSSELQALYTIDNSLQNDSIDVPQAKETLTTARITVDANLNKFAFDDATSMLYAVDTDNILYKINALDFTLEAKVGAGASVAEIFVDGDYVLLYSHNNQAVKIYNKNTLSFVESVMIDNYYGGIYVSDGKIYYSDIEYDIATKSSKTLYSSTNSFSSPGKICYSNNYILRAETNTTGGSYSVMDIAKDVGVKSELTFFQRNCSHPIAIDGGFLFFGRKILYNGEVAQDYFSSYGGIIPEWGTLTDGDILDNNGEKVLTATTLFNGNQVVSKHNKKADFGFFVGDKVIYYNIEYQSFYSQCHSVDKQLNLSQNVEKDYTITNKEYTHWLENLVYMPELDCFYAIKPDERAVVKLNNEMKIIKTYPTPEPICSLAVDNARVCIGYNNLNVTILDTNLSYLDTVNMKSSFLTEHRTALDGDSLFYTKDSQLRKINLVDKSDTFIKNITSSECIIDINRAKKLIYLSEPYMSSNQFRAFNYASNQFTSLRIDLQGEYGGNMYFDDNYIAVGGKLFTHGGEMVADLRQPKPDVIMPGDAIKTVPIVYGVTDKWIVTSLGIYSVSNYQLFQKIDYVDYIILNSPTSYTALKHKEPAHTAQ